MKVNVTKKSDGNAGPTGSVARATSNKINPRGQNHRRRACRRYSRKNYGKRFDDLTGTIFMGRHPSLSVGLAHLYLMGLSLSNRQMAQELNLDESDGQAMAEPRRGGIVQRRSPERLPRSRGICS